MLRWYTAAPKHRGHNAWQFYRDLAGGSTGSHVEFNQWLNSDSTARKNVAGLVNLVHSDLRQRLFCQHGHRLAATNLLAGRNHLLRAQDTVTEAVTPATNLQHGARPNIRFGPTVNDLDQFRHDL